MENLVRKTRFSIVIVYETTKLTDPCSVEARGRYYSEFEIAVFGWNMVRCGCIARAHYDDVIDIEPQIQVALESFKRVTEVDSIFDVSRPVDRISNSINTDGICEAEIYDNEFKVWGPYGGLQLETDWRSKIRRACDVTFRALLVLHYSDLCGKRRKPSAVSAILYLHHQDSGWRRSIKKSAKSDRSNTEFARLPAQNAAHSGFAR